MGLNRSILPALFVLFFALTLPIASYALPYNNAPVLDSLEEDIIKQVHELHNYLEETDRYTDYLDATSLLDFPIGIKKTIGNLEYVIAIDSVVMTPTFAYLNASMSFKPPQSNERLAFRGTNIKFTKNGGLSGDVLLELLGNQHIPIIGSKDSLIFRRDGTYVEWDCDGFKQFGLSAALLFSRDKFRPVSVGDSVDVGGFVTANFEATLNDWNDLIASASITPFEVVGVEDFVFKANNALFDFSDLRNPGNVRFPDNYLQGGFDEGNENLWRGFYVQEVRVMLPPQFKNYDGKRPEFIGSDIIIDEFGISAKLHGRHLLSLNDSSNAGSMEEWAFSLDSIGIDLQTNRLRSAGFEGEIVIPIADKSSPFQFHGFIDHANQYFFHVTPAEQVDFPLWQVADVELYESSFIEVTVSNGRFIPKASLNGIMNVGSESEKPGGTKDVSLANIEFEELVVQTQAPFLSAKAFSFGSEQSNQSLGSFPVTIQDIGFRAADETESSLDFNFLINLTPSESSSISADAGLSIISSINSSEMAPSWKFKKLNVRDILIDANTGAFEFYGSIQFFSDDPLYGTGFNGEIDATFKPGIKVKASALFGSVNSMRYWYADALASFPTPLQVFPGFGISGFGGGAYYRVKMKKGEKSSQTTLSGIKYTPDPDTGLGLLASLAYSSPTQGAYNGDVSFEMNFYKGGGAQNISFNGNAYFVTQPAKVSVDKLKNTLGELAIVKAESSNKDTPVAGSDAMIEQVFGPIGQGADEKAQISAKIRLNYDFGNAELHANMLTYVNAAKGLVIGSGPSGRAGWAVMHFAPAEWQIMIGNPTNRLGLNFGIKKMAVKASGYFMAGTHIPGSPPPHENVSNILGGIDLDYMREENALGNGSGFAFGAAFNMNTGDISSDRFYARFAAGAGFDLMLKNYGTEINCVGRSGPLGINGWYANGQAYAYFDGKIGLNVDVFGDKRKIDIINVAAASVLQTKLPNPFWMRGIVGGHFDILGGLIKGECRFEAVIGEECDISGESVLSGFKVIAAVTPDENEKDVNVFNNPQAVFNIPVGKTFELLDIDEVKKRFRVKLDHFKVHDATGIIEGELKWNDRLDVVAFNPFEILPPRESLDLNVQISFEEFKNGNWEPVTKLGNKIVEHKNISFVTGEAPDHIPLENVELSYPVVGMYNYYPKQFTTGFIKLKKGQSYLFDYSKEWLAEGSFKPSNNEKRTFDYDYDRSNKQVNFSIPALGKGQIYAFQLLLIPENSRGDIDRNVFQESTLLASSSAGGNIEVSTQQVEGSIDELQEKVLLSSEIRSSSYGTFQEKVLSFAELNTSRILVIPWRIHALRKSFSATEYFDKAELSGNQYTGFTPLVKAEATLAQNEYYQKDINPLIYADYPIDNSFLIDNRDTEVLGIPPDRAMKITQQGVPNGLTQPLTTWPYGSTLDCYLYYRLPQVFANDFSDIQTQAIVQYSNANGDVSDRISNLAFALYPVIRKGEYKVKLKYYLPGQNTEISDTIISIHNPNKR